jgi:ribose transport system substrate-binding protein
MHKVQSSEGARRVSDKHGRYVWAAAIVVAASALLLPACSSSAHTGGSATSSSSPSTTASSAPSSPGTTASSATGSTEQKLAGYKAITPWAPPGHVTGVSAASGKLVYWIQLTSGIPTYAIRQSGMEAAFGILGIHLQICNANLTPSGAAACAQQALNAKAAGIILDAIPVAWIAAQMSQIQSTGTALELAEQGFPTPTFPKEGAVAGNLPLQNAMAASWVIVDSGGKANVIIVGSPDVLVATYVGGALNEFQQDCSGCQVTVIKPDFTQLPQLPATVSAAITSHPNTNYVLSFSETEVPSIQRGIGLSGKGSSIKLVSGGGVTLNGLQSVQSGSLAADAGDGGYLFGWVEADQILRLILGQPPAPNYSPPNRLFDNTNLAGLQLTQAAQSSGQWWGVTDVEAVFKQTWGLG